MRVIERFLSTRRAEWRDAVRACRGEISWSSRFWARARMCVGVMFLVAAAASLYVVMTERMPGPDDFLARESYQTLAHMTDRSAVVFLGSIVHYGLLTLPLMYVFLAWIVVTYPFRRN